MIEKSFNCERSELLTLESKVISPYGSGGILVVLGVLERCLADEQKTLKNLGKIAVFWLPEGSREAPGARSPKMTLSGASREASRSLLERPRGQKKNFGGGQERLGRIPGSFSTLPRVPRGSPRGRPERLNDDASYFTRF